MSHDPLEQLRAELSVEPSPEFVAKVRARIAREPKRRWTTMVVWSLAAAAAVVVAAVVVSVPRSDRPTSVARVEAPPADAVSAPRPSAVVSSPVVSAATRPVAAAAVRHANVQPAEALATRLEVLVPADQRQAVDRLIGDLNGGRLDPAALAFTSVDQQAELPKPAAIAVAPIEIPAIPGLDIKK